MAAPPPETRIEVEDVEGLRRPERLLEPLNDFLAATHKGLTKGLTLAENFAGEVRTLTLTPPDEWVPLTFGVGWSQWVDDAYAPCAVRVAPDLGTVELRGVAQNGGSGLANVAQVPAEYRPSHTLLLPAVADEAATVAYVRSDEWVRYQGSAPVTWLNLHGLRWPLAGPVPPWTKPTTIALGERFPGTPSAVLILRAVDVAARASVALPSVPAWEPVDIDNGGRTRRKGVRLTRVAGLASGREYELTVLVLGG